MPPKFAVLRRSKFSLRVTLTTLLLTLVFITVATLGYSSYVNARVISKDLSDRILVETSQRVDSQLNNLMQTANRIGDLNRKLLESGQFDVKDFGKLARYWVDVMTVNPRITRLSIGMEATGEWFYVRRHLDGRLFVGELRRNSETGRLERTIYRPDDYPHRRFSFDADKTDLDPRTRPWYIAGRKAGPKGQDWSETYVLDGSEGDAEVVGLTNATPIYAPDASLLGVLGVTFNLIELCDFLAHLHVPGTVDDVEVVAFVVEYKRDETRTPPVITRNVIAHPDPTLLLRAASDEVKDSPRELVPLDELTDRRLSTFLGEVPPDRYPFEIKGTVLLPFVHDGVRYFGAYQCLSSQETPDWMTCIIIPESNVLDGVVRSNWRTFGIGLCILIVATLVSMYISTQIARPLERLARETEAIGHLRVEPHPVVHSLVREVDRLAVAVETTKTSLRSFQKYVPADLVRLLLSSGEEATLGGEDRSLTVYFCDLADFTAVSEALTPGELVRHMADYFGTFGAEILASGGTVDKFIGDAIMAFWGAPAASPRHALSACTTALRNQASLAALRRGWEAEGLPPLRARIGIHTGDVLVGNIGSEARLNYTVMGDTVNLASRLEGLNKFYGTEILISDTTLREAGPTLVARPVDWVSVKGKVEGVLIHEPLGLRGEVPAWGGDLAEVSDRALAHYRRRDWSAALPLFEQALRLRPEDGPSRLLIARCRTFESRPPAEDWDGVHRMSSK